MTEVIPWDVVQKESGRKKSNASVVGVVQALSISSDLLGAFCHVFYSGFPVVLRLQKKLSLVFGHGKPRDL